MIVDHGKELEWYFNWPSKYDLRRVRGVWDLARLQEGIQWLWTLWLIIQSLLMLIMCWLKSRISNSLSNQLLKPKNKKKRKDWGIWIHSSFASGEIGFRLGLLAYGYISWNTIINWGWREPWTWACIMVNLMLPSLIACL